MTGSSPSVGAFGGLSALQREFARAFVVNGGNGIKAALEAGYSPDSAARSVTKCLANAGVNAEIKKLSINNLSAKLPQLIGYLLEMAENPTTDARARVQAITVLMDRAGAVRQTAQGNVAVQVNVNGPGAQNLIAEIWENRQSRERALLSAKEVLDGSPIKLVGPVHHDDRPSAARRS